MTRKTEAAYSHLFKKIEDQWKISPVAATTDYEKALRNAIRKKYSLIKLIGCWFHFCQALRRKASKISGFLRYIKNHDDARKVYHKLMCLPLMRSDSISAAFELLKKEACTISKPMFNAFLSYIEQQWIQREGPQSISVFMEPERTNNPMESYNSKLNSKIPPHGCFYKFVELLRSQEFIKSRDYNIIRNGGSQVYHPQRKEYREKNEKIFAIQDKFANGNLNIEQFFQKAADLYETDLDIEEDEETDDDEDSNDDEEIEDVGNCEICHIRDKNTMLQPCNHMKFCKQCIQTLLEPQSNEQGTNITPVCPECNTMVTGHVYVFLWYFRFT